SRPRYEWAFHPAARANSRWETSWMTISRASRFRSRRIMYSSPIWMGVTCVIEVTSLGPWCPGMLEILDTLVSITQGEVRSRFCTWGADLGLLRRKVAAGWWPPGFLD